jgi:hypothetical protein
VTQLFLLAALAGAAGAGGLDFDAAFATKGEPASLHYRVIYRAPDGVHHLEVWRDGDRRLRRDTDGVVQSFAAHKAGDPFYRLAMLDRRRRIRTDVSRDAMYKIGSITDWFDLAHGLKHPLARYTLTASRASPIGLPATPAPCRWYDLVQPSGTARICWDAANRLPLQITTASGKLMWRVTAIDRRPIAPSVFAIHDEGFARNDADRDIEGD